MLKHTIIKTAVAVVTGLSLMGLATTANADTTHTVKSGDSLWAISQTYGTKMESIVAANSSKLSSINSLILPGETLSIPTGSNVTQTTKPSTNYSQTQQAPTSAQTQTQTQQATTQSANTSANVSQSSQTTTQSSTQSTGTHSGSTYSQFLAAGGTKAMWDAIVVPESGGQVNASNGRYKGLFQGDTSYGWPNGDAYSQTKGAIKYAVQRYGSVANAVNYRQSHNMW